MSPIVNRKIVIPFILVICVLIGSYLFFENKRDYELENLQLKVAQNQISEIQNYWINGDSFLSELGSKISCSNFPKPDKLDRDFLKCNPEFLNCQIKEIINKKKQLDNSGLIPTFKSFAGKYYQTQRKVKIGNDVISGVYKVQFKLGETDFYIYLEDSCRDSYLKKNTYAVGPFDKKKNDWFWDNLDRDIYIDIFPVRSYKFKIWMEPDAELKEKDFLSFAENPSQVDMEEYCSLHSGQVLTSSFLDAASFFPTRRGSNNKSFFRGPYTWDKYEQLEESFKDCSKIYAKECISNNFSIKSSNTPSWNGLMHVHGGLVEKVINKRNNLLEYFPSSFYFSFQDEAQKIGIRLNEESLVKIAEKFRYTFRCMVEREAYE